MRGNAKGGFCEKRTNDIFVAVESTHESQLVLVRILYTATQRVAADDNGLLDDDPLTGVLKMDGNLESGLLDKPFLVKVVTLPKPLSRRHPASRQRPQQTPRN